MTSSRSLPVKLIWFLALISLACKLSGQPTSAPRATRTPASTPAPQVYANPDYGVTIAYPAGWSTEQNDQSGAIIYIVSPGRMVISVLFDEGLSGNASLQDTAAQVRDGVLADMQDTQILRDEAFDVWVPAAFRKLS